MAVNVDQYLVSNGPEHVLREHVSVPQESVSVKVAAPVLSIVVPTRNEAGNVEVLVNRLEEALSGTPLEIIFVDDSDDNTVAAIELAQQRAQCDVAFIHREPGQRHQGLGGAVVAGMRIARAPWICVMDGDLQHPPEVVPFLLQAAQSKKRDLIVGSRYCADGDAGGLNQVRTLISRASTTAAKAMFPRRLRYVTDPMSGFFIVRKAALQLGELQPRGFKILLEIIARSPELRISEVPFDFAKRHAGTSKASLREGMKYMSHLLHLRFNEDSRRVAKFLAVGISGLIVNLLLLAVATDIFGIFYLVSAIIATQGSTLWNFGFTEHWVFRDRKHLPGRWLRMVLFLIMNNAALLLRGPILFILTSMLGVHYLVSAFISLVAMTALRYALADSWIWGRASAVRRPHTWYNYDIHGIVTVVSEVWLPELERFLTQRSIEQPTMRVHIGEVKPPPATQVNGVAEAGRHIYYDEGLGSYGFAIDVVMGDTIDVTASALLRRSPHVLYTNVVEPILRWTFVEKGYALVHGACITFGNRAYLVTARTDTGKTTTILRILDRQRRTSDKAAFLSDDLTLVSPDGRVMTYPKPLTISRHTVAAINTPLLNSYGTTWLDHPKSAAFALGTAIRVFPDQVAPARSDDQRHRPMDRASAQVSHPTTCTFGACSSGIAPGGNGRDRTWRRRRYAVAGSGRPGHPDAKLRGRLWIPALRYHQDLFAQHQGS